MAKYVELKDLAHGEQNIYKVRTRKLPSDTELERQRRTDYKQSADLVERARFTARVIKKGEMVERPFSWSLTNSAHRQDVKLPVVRAVIVEIPAGPSPDLQLNYVNNTPINPATTSFISSFDFIGTDVDLPLPEVGDDIWVDFENRKTLSGPIYLGMKTKGSTNPVSGSQTPSSSPTGQPIGLVDTAFPAPGQPVPKVAVSGSDIGVASNQEARITSGFGHRKDPVGRYTGTRNHQAWDIGVVQGTPVYALHDGVVTQVIMVPFGGGRGGIIIRVTSNVDGKKKIVSYVHLNKSFVAVGDTVTENAPLGRTGSAGTGPHLHFEVEEDGVKRSPTTEEASKALKRPVVYKKSK